MEKNFEHREPSIPDDGRKTLSMVHDIILQEISNKDRDMTLHKIHTGILLCIEAACGLMRWNDNVLEKEIEGLQLPYSSLINQLVRHYFEPFSNDVFRVTTDIRTEQGPASDVFKMKRCIRIDLMVKVTVARRHIDKLGLDRYGPITQC